MNPLLAFIIVGSAFLPAVLLLKAATARELQADPVSYRLNFPAGLEADAVTDFLAALSGLLLPWWRRWMGQPVVTLEVRADGQGIEHLLSVPGMSIDSVESALTAHLPSVRYERIENLGGLKMITGAEYRTSTDQRQLRINIEALSAGLLSALQPLGKDEQVIVQWQLTPASPVRPPRMRGKQDGVGINLNAELRDNSDAVTALKGKQAEPLLLAVGRVAVRASTRGRAETLLRRAESPMHGTRAPGAHLMRRFLPTRLVVGRVERQAVPLTRYPCVLNTMEAASLIGWPVGITQLPGLTLGGCRLLPVASAVPTIGTLLGTSTFPATFGRPVSLDFRSRLVHLHAIGPTGSGKSTLLANVVLSDIAAGYGVVVIDPKGDLITPILERMDENRLDDVIVLDAADDEHPVGYNPLSTTDVNRELVVDQVLGVMHAIWSQSWGPRLSEILHASLMTLSLTPGMTLEAARIGLVRRPCQVFPAEDP